MPCPSSQLRFYLDSADVSQWQAWLPSGLFYGVTSNPLLLEKAQQPCNLANLKNLANQAFDQGMQEVQIQTWGKSVAELRERGEAIAAIDPRVIVKVPTTQQGTTAASQLIAQGIPVTLTALYAVHQALIGAALGAHYVAPYLGRINDLGQNGRETLSTMQRALDGVESQTRILAASIRTIGDIPFLASRGLNTFTFSTAIAEAFFQVDATAQATQDFERAAQAMQLGNVNPAI
jgi:transaldolase